MTTITATEFQKNFGMYKQLAQREPVEITCNGRKSVVLISTAEYEKILKIRAQMRKSRYVWELSDEEFRGIGELDSIPKTKQSNHEVEG